MALPQSGAGDADEPGILLQLFNIRAAQVTHARPQPAHQLIHHRLQRAAMRHAALNALRNKLREAVLRRSFAGSQRWPLRAGLVVHVFLALKISLARALRHRAQAAHPAVCLERPPLVEDRLPRALIHAREQRPHHADARTRGDRLRHVARILDAAVGNHGNAALTRRAIRLRDCRDLRHPRARHHARRADRPRPDADLDRIRTRIDQRHRALIRRHIARQKIDVREGFLHLRNRLQHSRRVPMRRVNRQRVHTRLHQRRRTLKIIAHRSNRSRNPQPPLRVLRRVRVLQLLLNVLDRDQPLQLILVVHHQQLLHAMLMQDVLGLFQRRSNWHRDQVLLRHHRVDRKVGPRHKPQVAVRQDADQLLVLRHRHTGDLEPPHHLKRRRNRLVRRDRHRVNDHPAFRPLHLVDLTRLLLDAQVAMHHAQTTLLRHGNGKPRLGHSVHRRRHQRRIQRNVLRQLRRRADLRRHNVGVGRDQQNIVKRQGLGNRQINHDLLLLHRSGVGALRRALDLTCWTTCVFEIRESLRTKCVGADRLRSRRQDMRL